MVTIVCDEWWAKRPILSSVVSVSGASPEAGKSAGLRGDGKMASSNPGRSGGRILFSRVNFLC